MKTGYLIALATPQDCVELAVLVNSAYRGDSSRQGWTTEADYIGGQRSDPAILNSAVSTPGSSIYCLRAHAGGEILACVQVQLNAENEIYLGMLTVKPTLQARGLGRILLAHVETVAATKNARRIFMTVVQIRDTLIAWYERRGYRRTGDIKPFPYGKSEFGEPLRDDLHFVVLEKKITPL